MKFLSDKNAPTVTLWERIGQTSKESVGLSDSRYSAWFTRF